MRSVTQHQIYITWKASLNQRKRPASTNSPASQHSDSDCLAALSFPSSEDRTCAVRFLVILASWGPVVVTFCCGAHLSLFFVALPRVAQCFTCVAMHDPTNVSAPPPPFFHLPMPTHAHAFESGPRASTFFSPGFPPAGFDPLAFQCPPFP